MTSLERLTALVARRLDRGYLDPRIHELAVVLDRPELEQWYLERPR